MACLICERDHATHECPKVLAAFAPNVGFSDSNVINELTRRKAEKRCSLCGKRPRTAGAHCRQCHTEYMRAKRAQWREAKMRQRHK